MRETLSLSSGVALWLLLSLPGCSGATQDTVSASFTCDAGKTIQAVFTTGARPAVSLVLSDGRQLTLPQALSASGARYATADESAVFWNKGRTAFIDEHGRQTYSGCVQSDQGAASPRR
jgi:membrane-bound inhibitor of C-type lysozyme